METVVLSCVNCVPRSVRLSDAAADGRRNCLRAGQLRPNLTGGSSRHRGFFEQGPCCGARDKEQRFDFPVGSGKRLGGPDVDPLIPDRAVSLAVVPLNLVPSSRTRGLPRAIRFGFPIPVHRYGYFPAAAIAPCCCAIVCQASRSVIRHFSGPSRCRGLLRRFACSSSASM